MNAGSLREPAVPDVVLPGLAGRDVLVVGAASGGVGTATTAMLVRSGARVVAVDRAEDRLAALVARHPGTTPVVADVLTAEGTAAVQRAVAAADLAGLVNVVGGVTPGDIGHVLELTADQWRQGWELNAGYALETCRLAARRMVRTGRGGVLVNLSVADARRAMPWFAPYGSARSALESATRTMAVELGPFGIRANTVAWGLIDSPRAHSGAGSDGTRERDLIPLGRRGGVGDVASAVLYLLSDLAAYVTGQTVVVDGGQSLRAAHDGPRHNIPEFLELAGARAALRATIDRIASA
ncbi:SDR family NAD(P)-dependent oxidoreductase [Pseudonocardia lutea]|uniref:SDR family NAD(P)-dependent oxidoreductase n=1 Tax=Pseudonocardia lutea TaxID=2172015 RepID=A0ABW1ICR9_9PSEU